MRWLKGVALDRAREVALCGVGVAILLAHVTSVIGSPTSLPKSGWSIKRQPKQVSVRFRQVRAENSKPLGYIPGMHGYSVSRSHTYDTK